jgi:hypothetical protein
VIINLAVDRHVVELDSTCPSCRLAVLPFVDRTTLSRIVLRAFPVGGTFAHGIVGPRDPPTTSTVVADPAMRLPGDTFVSIFD